MFQIKTINCLKTNNIGKFSAYKICSLSLSLKGKGVSFELYNWQFLFGLNAAYSQVIKTLKIGCWSLFEFIILWKQLSNCWYIAAFALCIHIQTTKWTHRHHCQRQTSSCILLKKTNSFTILNIFLFFKKNVVRVFISLFVRDTCCRNRLNFVFNLKKKKLYSVSKHFKLNIFACWICLLSYKQMINSVRSNSYNWNFQLFATRHVYAWKNLRIMPEKLHEQRWLDSDNNPKIARSFLPIDKRAGKKRRKIEKRRFYFQCICPYSYLCVLKREPNPGNGSLSIPIGCQFRATEQYQIAEYINRVYRF